MLSMSVSFIKSSDVYLTKPINYAELIIVVETLVQRKTDQR